MSGRLGAILDGQTLSEEEARALWARFSAHMDANKGDLAGFAAAEGVASVQPETRAGKAVLVLSRTGQQQPYGQASTRSGAGSANPQRGEHRKEGNPRAERPGGAPTKGKPGRR